MDYTDAAIEDLRHILAGEQSSRGSGTFTLPVIDPRVGNSSLGNLCWICYAGPLRSGRMLPRFRACHFCLDFDRRKARRLGFRMLMPLMDWHTQPIEPGWKPPTDPTFRGWLADLWCEVSRLERWRIDGVRAAGVLLDIAAGEVVLIGEWALKIKWGAPRSKACWDAYVSGYHPHLFNALERVDQLTLEWRQRKRRFG